MDVLCCQTKNNAITNLSKKNYKQTIFTTNGIFNRSFLTQKLPIFQTSPKIKNKNNKNNKLNMIKK